MGLVANYGGRAVRAVGDKLGKDKVLEGFLKLCKDLNISKTSSKEVAKHLDGFVDTKKFDDTWEKVFGGSTVGKIFKNVEFATFKRTFTATEEQYAKAYQLWGEDKWDELYQHFKTNNLNYDARIGDVWPPFEGFRSITKTETGNQLAGKLFDRFQPEPGNIKGGFASPVYGNEGVSNLHFTYDSRALSNKIADGTNYFKFKFKNNVPADLKFDYGDVQPWFGKSGLGDQVKSSKSLAELWDNGRGVIEIVEQLEYQGGKWIRK